jgi:NAD dependent epimerase/dehydratase family enzyme
MQDLLGIIEHALYTHELKGPVNAVSPTPCTNRDFAKALGSVLRRPAVVPTPAFALKAIFGEMAQELLLSNMRIVPQALMKSGYQFVLSDLSRALRFECGLVAGEPLPR